MDSPRKWLMSWLVALVVTSFAASVMSGDTGAPKGTMILSATGKKPAIFNHEAHVLRSGGSCVICHHTDAEGTGSKCMSCHSMPAKKGIPDARRAFHECIKCHTPGKGPIYPKDCNTCHVRPGV